VKQEGRQPPRDKEYTFEDVARFVCKGADPGEGLVRYIRRWTWPMEGFPVIEQKPQLTRKQMVKALTALISAANTILGGLSDGQQMGFVMTAKSPFDRVALMHLLHDLRHRCNDAIASPALSSAKGDVKSGPGSVATPDRTDPKMFCARMVLLTWRALHGAYPGSRNPHAAQAAEALFHLAIAPPGRSPLQRKRPSVGNPLNGWRRTFEVARANEPIFGPLHDIILNRLHHALASDKASKDGHPAG
jgi:hypothetical protein